MKVMTLVGTRPELIKLSCVIEELDRHVDHVLVHSGQNHDHGLNGIFFDEMGIRRPDHELGAVGATAAETIANVIAAVDPLIVSERPDAFLIYGDTNSCLGAIAAKRRRVPVFHLEAGNRSFDDRVPEEVNRRILDHACDVNVTISEHARRHLLAEGLPADRVVTCGSPMREVLERQRSLVDDSTAAADLELTPGRYIVVSAHREENVDDADRLAAFVASLELLTDALGVPVVVSTHPRTRRRLDEHGIAAADGDVRFLPPLGFGDYVRLQRDSLCVVSDSGTVTEESALVGFPAVTIRQAHERPEGTDRGALVMADLRPEDVLTAVRMVVDQHARHRPAPPEEYLVDDFSQRVTRLIVSYAGYVDRTVWRR